MKLSVSRAAACALLGVCLVAFGSVGAGAVPQAQAAPSKATVAAAYKAYKSKRFPGARTKTVDIDRNGVAELLVHDGYDGMFVYTYSKKKHKVVKVKGMSTGKGYTIPLCYSTGKHRFVLGTFNTGGGEYVVYRLSGTKAKRVKKFTYDNGRFTSDHKPVFRVNGKKVGEAAYDAAYAKATKGFKKLKSPLA